MLLENKVALIYGGGGAIGGAVASAFAREGAKVYLVGRTQAKLDTVADKIRTQGGVVETAVVDALDEAAVDAFTQITHSSRRSIMQKITPYLWFDNNAEEALNFYTSIFKDTKISDVMRYGPENPALEGMLMAATFQLEGQEFMALNAGPQFKFTEAISFFVRCETQEEVDHYWYKLIADGGEEQPCGWLKDKFGLSWQIIPNILGELMRDKNPAKAQAVMNAMFQMKKIDIPALQDAYEQS